MGTPGSVYHHSRTSNLPVRNFQDPRFPEAKSRQDRKLLFGLLSTGAPDDLRANSYIRKEWLEV